MLAEQLCTRARREARMSENQIITALIHLPLFYNADESGVRSVIEDEKFALTSIELTGEFGGCLLHLYRDSAPQGFWWQEGIVYGDDIALIEVDLPDSEESRQWLKNYAQNVLMARFQQKAIYI